MPPKKHVREMELPGNQKLSVTEVNFDVMREDWGEYKLSDGSTVRVRNVVLRIFLQVDNAGNVVYNEHGEPNVVVVGNQLIVPLSKKE